MHPAGNSAQQNLSVVEMRAYLSSLSDAELVVASQQGNELAFDVLIRKNQRLISSILFKLAPDFKDKSDLIQEALLRVWRSIGSLRNPHAFARWTRQLVVNLFYDELRQRPRQGIVSLDEPLDSDEPGYSRLSALSDHASGPDELSLHRELSRAIHQAVDELPMEFRKALVLREFDGLSYDEIASLTQSEMGTVKSRILRARRKVQSKLECYLAS